MDSDLYYSQSMSMDWDGGYLAFDQVSWDSCTTATSPSDDKRLLGIVLCDVSPDIILPSPDDEVSDTEEETLAPSPSEVMDSKQSPDWDITYITVSASDIELDFELDGDVPFTDLQELDGSCLGTNLAEISDDCGIVWKTESENEFGSESEGEIKEEIECGHPPGLARRNLNFGAPRIKSERDDDFQGYMSMPEEVGTQRDSSPEIEVLPEIERAHYAQDLAGNNAHNSQDLAWKNADISQHADDSQDRARRRKSSGRTPSTSQLFKFVNKTDKERSPGTNSFFEVKIAFFGTRGKSFLKVLDHHQSSPTKRLRIGEDYEFLSKNFTPLQELKKQEKYQLKKVVNCFTKNSYSRLNYMELACMLNLSNYDLRLTKLVQSTVMEIFSELFVDFKFGSHRWNRDIDRDRRKFMINLLHKYTSIWYPEIDLQVLDILIRRASYSGMQKVSRSARKGTRSRSFWFDGFRIKVLFFDFFDFIYFSIYFPITFQFIFLFIISSSFQVSYFVCLPLQIS